MDNKYIESSQFDIINSLALIGPYPPPYGGVAIHVERIKPILEKENINCFVYNLGHKGVQYTKSSIPQVINIKYPKLWILWYFISSKENLIHNHYTEWKLAFILGFMSIIGKKLVITIHSKEFFSKDNWLIKKLIIFALKQYSLIIVVNNDIKNICLSAGIDKSNIKVIPAFISPIIKQKEIMEINKDVSKFIESHSPIISANAYAIAFTKNQEVYGIDICIDLCEKIIKNHKNIGFVFLLSKIGDNEYFEKMQQRIVDKNLEKNFKLIKVTCQFYPILMKSDLFIRPTNTDGDAISVREALYLGIPTIASDVVNRPKGTILFKNRDVNDLTFKVEHALKDNELNKNKIIKTNLLDYSKQLVDTYQNLFNK